MFPPAAPSSAGVRKIPRSSPGHGAGNKAPQACSAPALPMSQLIPQRAAAATSVSPRRVTVTAAAAARSCSQTRSEPNTGGKTQDVRWKRSVSGVFSGHTGAAGERNGNTRYSLSLPLPPPSLCLGACRWRNPADQSLSEPLYAPSEETRDLLLSGFNVLLDTRRLCVRVCLIISPGRGALPFDGAGCAQRSPNMFCGFRH